MYFLIDPVYHPDQYLLHAREIREAYAGLGAVAVATVTKVGSQSVRLGDKLLIRENGKVEGSLGDKVVDEDAVARAMSLMIHGRNQYVVEDQGLEYILEAYTTPPQLVLCGGGHVSKAISVLAKPLGFRLFVTDDREEFANADRFPEADIIVAKKPEKALGELPVNPNTFIVIATRGHRYDGSALMAAARTQARYVGLMGSLRKTILIYEDLLRNGLPIERVKEIRSPIGLDINARTPEEIAVSIISEILMFRLGGSGISMKIDNSQLTRIEKKVGIVFESTVGVK